MKKFPIGIQSFEYLQTNTDEYIYVDKTKELYDLVNQGKYYFLSRPRRFGKSLLCSTMQALFEGKKELFKGLWIEQSDWQWEKHPVIHISFSKMSHLPPEELKQSLQTMLHIIANQYDVTLPYDLNPGMMLTILVSKLAPINNVILIIDEYDKPILDNITNLTIAQQTRDILKKFL